MILVYFFNVFRCYSISFSLKVQRTLYEAENNGNQ